MAFVRLLGGLLKDATLGPRIVPIVADEARTFGMANLFKQVGIYSSVGQRYAPEDIGSVLSYREALDGQILEEGISEAGAIASWTARPPATACTARPCRRSTSTTPCSASSAWAMPSGPPPTSAPGLPAGRYIRAHHAGGEGLQHQDGSSHLMAATIPNRARRPGLCRRDGVIIDAGMREMLGAAKDVFYYVTLMNENYAQPDLPVGWRPVVRVAINFVAMTPMKGEEPNFIWKNLTLLGSGAILTEVDPGRPTNWPPGRGRDGVQRDQLERTGP